MSKSYKDNRKFKMKNWSDQKGHKPHQPDHRCDHKRVCQLAKQGYYQTEQD